MTALPAPTAAVFALRAEDGSVMLQLLYGINHYALSSAPDIDVAAGYRFADVLVQGRHILTGHGRTVSEARRHLLDQLNTGHTPTKRANVVVQPLTDQEEEPTDMADFKLIDRLAQKMRDDDGPAGQATSMDTYRGWAQVALEALETMDGVTLVVDQPEEACT